jgi:hypothetical protein
MKMQTLPQRGLGKQIIHSYCLRNFKDFRISLLDTDTRTKMFNLYYTPTSPSKCTNFCPTWRNIKGLSMSLGFPDLSILIQITLCLTTYLNTKGKRWNDIFWSCNTHKYQQLTHTSNHFCTTKAQNQHSSHYPLCKLRHSPEHFPNALFCIKSDYEIIIANIFKMICK